MNKLFKINDVFEKIETPKIKAKANDFPTQYSEDDCVPLLTAGAENQGLNRYAKKTDCPMILKNCISISANGANSGICFYQPHDFAVLQDAYAVQVVGHVIQNAEEGLYLTGALNKSIRDNHDWVNKAGWNHIKTENIELPVLESSTPNHEYTVDDIDWNYMQERIRELEEERIRELEAYLIATGLDDYELTIEDEMILKGFFDDSIYFQEMTLQEMGFSIYHGRRLNKSDRIDGDIPFITAGEANQGVAQYISNPYETYHNPITVDMFGNCFYHSGDCAGDDNIYFFVNDEIDEHAKLFIVGEITKKIKGLYSYTRQFRQNDANKLPVKMPLNTDGSINWEYIYIYTSSGERNNPEHCYVEKQANEYFEKYRVKYSRFNVSDLFEVAGTKSIDAGNINFKTKGINFIGRTNDNNGIQGKIGMMSYQPNPANTITATVIGNYKYVKYQEEPYYCSQNINRLTLLDKYNYVLNRWSAEYLMSHIRKFVEIYNGQQGGYKLPDLKNHKIILPITHDGQPNFRFMENYIKAMEKLIIADVVEYKNKLIQTTKQIIL